MPVNKENSVIHSGFKHAEPSKKLSSFVECYWFINTDMDSPISTKEYLYPEGDIGIIFNYDQAYFISPFKKVTGIIPREYLKKLTKNKPIN